MERIIYGRNIEVEEAFSLFQESAVRESHNTILLIGADERITIPSIDGSQIESIGGEKMGCLSLLIQNKFGHHEEWLMDRNGALFRMRGGMKTNDIAGYATRQKGISDTTSYRARQIMEKYAQVDESRRQADATLQGRIRQTKRGVRDGVRGVAKLFGLKH